MKNKKPEVRFKGFSEEWEEKELGEISEVTKLAGFEFTEYIIYSEEGDIIALRGLNVKKGKIVLDEVKYIDKSDFSKLNRSKLFVGDVLLTYVGTVGELAIIPENDKYYLAPNVARIRFKNEYVPEFIIQVMGSQQFFDKTIFPLIATSSQPALSMLNVRKFILKLPQTAEQTQIGNFFKNLDNLITLHQRKYEKLGILKKAMLEKMFPKNGADVPEIRFKGFSGAWEERTLGDLFGIASASRVHKHEWTESGVPFFRSSDVVSDFKGQENTKAFISFELYEELSKKSGCVQKNDILVTGGGSIGIPYLVKSNEPLYFKDADLLWLKNSDNLNGYFLYIFFSTVIFRDYINSITHTGTISHYTIEQAKATPIKVPKREEQEKIGNYFKNLDNLLTLHRGELEKLKNLKKALLEKMFV